MVTLVRANDEANAQDYACVSVSGCKKDALMIAGATPLHKICS